MHVSWVKGPTEPMWQVIMGLTYLCCQQHKKLISHETVAEIKEMTEGAEEFDKIHVRVFTEESGWLRDEPDQWV